MGYSFPIRQHVQRESNNPDTDIIGTLKRLRAIAGDAICRLPIGRTRSEGRGSWQGPLATCGGWAVKRPRRRNQQ